MNTAASNSKPRATAAQALVAFSASAGATRLTGALLQLYLGFVFLPEDFALLALFTTASLFANALRDGGVKAEIIRLRTSPEDAVVVPSAYWLAWLVNGGLALLLGFLAEPISTVYGAPALAGLLMCLAIIYPLGSLWSVAGALIQTSQSASKYVRIEIEGETIRLIAALALLSVWTSPYALASAIAVQNAWLSARAARALPLKIRQPWPGFGSIRKLWGRTHWLMSGTLAAALLQSGDYIALGLVSTATLLGGYYFAYSIAAQASAIAVALGDSMLLHLAPPRTAARQTTLEHSIRWLVTCTGLVTYSVAVSFPYAEEAIWRGKWDYAVPATQVLAILLPLRMTFIVQKVALVSTGAHRFWSVATLLQGSGMTLTALGVGASTDSLTVVALTIGAYLAVATTIGLCVALRRESLGSRIVVRTVGLGLRIPALAATIGWAVSTACTAAASSTPPAIMAALSASATLLSGLLLVRLIEPRLFASIVQLLSSRRSAGTVENIQLDRRSC